MIEVGSLQSLVGKTLLGRSGVRVGKVTDVYQSDDGAATFATVATGLFGTSSSLVSLTEAELHGDDVHVPYTKELIADAPRVAPGRELSTQEETELFAHYGASGGGPRPAAGDGDGDGVMTRSEERLHVGTERVETGRARLRKYVVTETVTQTVPVSHEELRIVREPLEPDAPGLPVVTELSEEEHEVVLSAQRPVVEKELVAVERIRLETETVTGQETVSEQVRKEQVEVLPDLPPAETTVLPRPEQPAPEVESTTRTELFLAPGHEGPDGEDVPPPPSDTEYVIEPRH